MIETPTALLQTAQIRDIIRRALAEDMPWGDVTSDALIPEEARCSARLVMRETGVVCGLEVAAQVFLELDPGAQITINVPDGAQAQADTVIAEIAGRTRAILSAERTALNVLQRMCGIATTTAAYVASISGTGARIVDTRKTVPGLRILDRYAVRCGGGSNHRFSLSDGVLVKDNHLAAAGDDAFQRILAMRSQIPHTLNIEIEVDDEDQIEDALNAGAGIILLDNMSLGELRRAVAIINGRALTEASGGITLETVREAALTGVNLISIGALTHSVRALDIALDL